ncbi:potassium/sodium hyperpolarization-activated cyclic nucleotide-gated channel 4-like [Lutra lutra]|uniref:potassium/sodium hyperpolarization-activated cyclic nucleotide-gated channel 4-like n=1 Tax=Lutra lutra TaxID=9657 RepID=UPI001FD2A1EF|nr:potassium/sodium hyperpolarization-activated cyclic nucleotide-gated channel 4-like [Lutra lutra]
MLYLLPAFNIPTGPRSIGQKKRELPSAGNASLEAPDLPEPRGVAARSPPSEAWPSPGRALPASGKVRLAQSPAGLGTPRFSLRHRGAQPARAPSAQPRQSSAGREEKKQQPPHRSGRTRGEAGAASVSPTANSRQRKRRYPRNTPCKHRDPEVGGGGGRGNALPGTLPAPAPPFPPLRLARAPPIANAKRR